MSVVQRRRALVAGAGAVAGILGAPAAALAQALQGRPITFVLGSGPGSTYEPVVRYLNAEFPKQVGQPLIIDYKPGAGGMIGANFVRSAKPDGLTYLYGSVLGIHPIFIKNNPIVATRDLTPVTACAFTPWVLGAASRFKNTQDLIAYSKANPGRLKVGHSTLGVMLTGAQMMQKLGLTGEFIPYKSGTQMTLACASGEIDMCPSAINASMNGLIDSGKMNGIMITSDKRAPSLPGTPTVAELGFPDLAVLGVTQGVWGPPGLPAEIANAFSASIAKILRTPEADKALATAVMGDLLASTPQEQARRYDAEMRFIGDAARAINFKAE